MMFLLFSGCHGVYVIQWLPWCLCYSVVAMVFLLFSGSHGLYVIQ